MTSQMEDRLMAILNNAALRAKNLKWLKDSKFPEEALAEERGKIQGLLDAARIMTIEHVGGPDDEYRCDIFSVDCDGIYRNNELVLKI